MRCYWPAPPREFQLSEQEVHVWCAELDLPDFDLQHYQALLSSEELERASRYRFPGDQKRYILRRGILRELIGRYLNSPATSARFTANEFGKPALAEGFNSRLKFNLSVSEDVALIALTEGREIGVDIERVRQDFEVERIARRFFSIYEQTQLHKASFHQKIEAFFNCWTRKEAYVKAHGQGLTLPLDQFDVSLLPSEPARLLATRHAPAEIQRWSMQHLSPIPGYVGALVVEGGDWQLICWKYLP
jgi:4'-phosphopantetheinyl transferase